MVNAAREKWPTIVLTGSLAGADNENSMLNHDYSVSFHFSVFVVVFFYSAGCIHTHTKQHRRNSDLTKRKSRSTQIYTSPLSLAIVYCATDAQLFSFRSFLVVRRLIKKRKKIRTKRVDRSIFNDRILFFLSSISLVSFSVR